MATEKQTQYIKDLVNGLKIENMEWVKKLEGMRKSHREFKIQTWIDDAMSTRMYENEISLEDAIQIYNTRLNEINNNTEAMNVQEASKAIENLKKCKVVW